MKIDRRRAQQCFEEYVSHYDIGKSMIRLKVEHTIRVADLCEQIALSLKMKQAEVDLAWLIGLLHDIGRFEQQKNYGTFNDAESIDHAQYGVEILFGEDAYKEDIFLRNFVADKEEDVVIRTAIFWHSAYRIPEDLDERTKCFCHILRDADKIDILKVNVEFPLEEIYNVTTKALYECKVTEDVMVAFEEEHAILRSLKRTPVDNVVGHISLVYELVYAISLRIVKEQGYLDKLMAFQSWNETACQQFAYIREKIQRYIEQKVG